MADYIDGLIKQVKQHNDTVYLTIGFRWKNPTTMDKPLTPAQAVEWLTKYAGKYALVELKESNGWLHLNAFTSGDMW